MRRLGWVVVGGAGLALVAIASVHLFLPSSTANGVISTLPLVAHGLAFPLQSGALLTLLGVGVITLALRNRRGHGRRRMSGALEGGIVVIAGLLVTLSGTNIALPHSPRGVVQEGSTSFVMVTWNALDHFDGASAQQIFGTLGADIAVLPELDERLGTAGNPSRIEAALLAGELDPKDFVIFESPPTGTPIAPLTVIVRTKFARYESVPVEQVNFGTVHLIPADGSASPEILAFHTAPPLPRLMSGWTEDLATIRGIASTEGTSAIMAGDLNATLRHGALGGVTSHGDVVATIPAINRGSWPLKAPQILRSSIDHILIPMKLYEVIDAEIIDVAGSDHAAVVATVSLRA